MKFEVKNKVYNKKSIFYLDIAKSKQDNFKIIEGIKFDLYINTFKYYKTAYKFMFDCLESAKKEYNNNCRHYITNDAKELYLLQGFEKEYLKIRNIILT